MDGSTKHLRRDAQVERAAEEICCVIVDRIVVAGAIHYGPSSEGEFDIPAVAECLSDV